MGNFCEAFGLTNIEAPSTKAKRIQKKSATQIKKTFSSKLLKTSSSKKGSSQQKETTFQNSNYLFQV